MKQIMYRLSRNNRSCVGVLLSLLFATSLVAQISPSENSPPNPQEFWLYPSASIDYRGYVSFDYLGRYGGRGDGGWIRVGEITWPQGWSDYRGYIKFDLAEIPATACIDSVVLGGQSVNPVEGAPFHVLSVRHLNLDPGLITSDSVLYHAIEDGYEYDTCHCMRYTGFYKVNLGPQAAADVASAIGQGWKTFGLMQSNPFGHVLGNWDFIRLKVYALVTSIPPDKPVASTLTPCADSIYSISWAPIAGVTGYRLYENSVLVYEGTDTVYQVSRIQGTYSYELSFGTTCDWSVKSAIETVTVLNVPGIPADPTTTLSAPCTGVLYTVSWTSVPGATLHRLLENGSQVYQGPSAMAISFTRQNPGVFNYTVQAGNGCSFGAPSGGVTVTVRASPGAPAAPSISDSSPCPNDSFSVRWQSVVGAIAYHLYENSQLVYGGGDTTRAFSYSSGSYEYEIDAVNVCGTGVRSPVSQVAIQSAPPVPAVPLFSTPTPCADSSFSVSWNAIAGVSAYRLYENNAIIYEGIDTSIQLSYPSGVYNYHSSAGNDCGQWSPAGTSSQVSIQQPPVAPTTPTASTPVPCPNQPYTIHWNGPSGASLYRLYENDILVYEGTDTLHQYSYAAGVFAYYVESGNLCGEWSAQSGARTVSIQTAPSAPAAPIPDIALPCTSQLFTLSWSPVEGALGYYLYESDTLWNKLEDTLIQLSLADGLYAFTATAYNSCELFSVPSGITVVSVGNIPAAPDTLYADRDTVNVGQDYTVSWNSPGPGIAYRLYENDVGVYSGKEVSLVLSQATAGDYIYNLQVCNDCDCSDRSSSLLVVVVDATGCCIGMTGNIDGDQGDNTDISDLTYVVNYIFLGGSPPSCWEESDLTLDGATDISDLTYLVSYVFLGGPPPPPCP